MHGREMEGGRRGMGDGGGMERDGGWRGEGGVVGWRGADRGLVEWFYILSVTVLNKRAYENAPGVYDTVFRFALMPAQALRDKRYI